MENICCQGPSQLCSSVTGLL
uniref:Uncharacterized protein n=1 Tax=Anguilla anguilla TaxID=7936 RepID=A0A0E9Q8N1_ANGAN